VAVTPNNASTIPEDVQVARAHAQELFRQLDRIEKKLDEMLAYLRAQPLSAREGR
jgi:hypothetical protein